MMSGNGAPTCVSGALRVGVTVLLDSESVGYQISVTSVRLGAPGNVPLGIVGRFVSTKVMVMTPTPYAPGCSTCALVRGAAVGVAVGVTVAVAAAGLFVSSPQALMNAVATRQIPSRVVVFNDAVTTAGR